MSKIIENSSLYKKIKEHEKMQQQNYNQQNQQNYNPNYGQPSKVAKTMNATIVTGEYFSKALRKEEFVQYLKVSSRRR